MDIQTVDKMEKVALKSTYPSFLRLSLALMFILVVFIWTYTFDTGLTNNTFLIIGGVFGAYMAMNIGANDVANNMGPAVGSNAITMFWAIIIAATCEAAGAFIAGGEVVKTIKDGIIDPAGLADTEIFIWAMTAALLSAAIWLNFATFVGAPVSTTHSIVGAVMGAGIAAAGFEIVAWEKMGQIAASWIISPILGGVVAALFLFFIKKSIVYKIDKIEAAKIYVPILVSIMAWAFSTYIILKGLKQVIEMNFFSASVVGLAISIVVYILTKQAVASNAKKLDNHREDINKLFTIPLIFSAALLSFAHGANDVANAVGPLAGISDAVLNGEISGKASIPLWVMAIGAIGISIGLALYGPKLIRTVGSEITELDQMRAYSIAMSAAITVIIASQLGLPVSSTHIAIGGVFGVGFLREWLSSTSKNSLKELKDKMRSDDKIINEFKQELQSLEDIEKKSKHDYQRIVDIYKQIDVIEHDLRMLKKGLKSAKKIKYVKRDAVKKIIAAWIITVPVAAMLSAGVFFMIKGIMH